jgi:hypothetical protein
MDGAQIILNWLTQEPVAAAGFLFGETVFAVTLCICCYDYTMLGEED